MVDKCKVEGCDNPAGKSGYCKKHFGEFKIAELEKKGILETFIGLFKKPLSAVKAPEKVEEEKKKVVTTTPSTVERPSTPQIIKVQPTKPTTTSPTPPQEEKKKFSSAKEEAEELEAKLKLSELRKKIAAQEEAKTLEKGTPKEKIGAFFKQRGITTERLKKPIGTDDLLKGLGKGFDKFADKTGQRVGVSKDLTKNALLFAFYFPLTIAAIRYMLIPSIEGFGFVIDIPGFDWLRSQTWDIVVVVFALMFGVVLPPSLVLGKKAGINFAAFNTVLLSITAISAGAWGTTHIFQPTLKAWMPEEYALMMCLIKYKGSMQICMGVGNQTVQYEKVGTYETLASEMGVVTPSRRIPPVNPVPEMWNQYPYIFTYTLSNKNEVGSPYDITVSEMTFRASSTGDFDGAIIIGDPLNVPESEIKPGGNWVVQAEFKVDSLDPTLICDIMYTFFEINITTKQIGGGSSKIGIVEDDKEINNQNFMYFFDPDVKTEPGPVDIYTYTLPFIMPWNQLKNWQNCPNPPCHGFTVFIHISNNGGGEVVFEKLDLIQKTDGIRLTNVDGKRDCTLMSISKTSSEDIVNVFTHSSCGGDNCISFNIIPKIFGGGNIIIACRGSIDTQEGFIGKTTEFISVDAKYEYKQSNVEQIACYQMPGATTTTTLLPCSWTVCELGVADTCLCGSAIYPCSAGQFCCADASSCHANVGDCCVACGC